MPKKLFFFFLLLCTVFLAVLVWLQQPATDPADTASSQAAADGLPPTVSPDLATLPDGAAPSASPADDASVQEERSALSSPDWRPAAVFGGTMNPVPPRKYPRGQNASRRYHATTTHEIDPALAARTALTLAQSPGDGRFHLLPEEIEVHTRQAGRLVFDPAALNQVVQNQISRVLVPTLTDEVLTLAFEKIVTRSTHTHTLQGHVVGEESNSIVQIVYHDGILHGSVMRYSTGQELEYRILPDGYMMVRELDQESLSQENCGTCTGCSSPAHADLHAEVMASMDVEGTADEGINVARKAGEDGPVTEATPGWRTIDVTVGYTVEARIADGGYAQIEARIIASVDRMTLAFANSAIPETELMLIGTIEDPDYVEDSLSRIYDAHNKLRNPTDGVLDAVTDFHAQLGSDLASIVTSAGQGGTAGVAVMGSWSSSNSRTAMTAGLMTFEHELGHNLGGAHAWGDTSTDNTGINMGWRFQGTSGTKYSTIMAYDFGWGIRIPYYSNPNVLHPDGNVPTGCVAGYDATSDPTVDPALKPGYDGSVSTRGANNALALDTGEGHPDYGATVAANRATRTDFAVLAPAASAQWEKGTTRTISFNGGDMEDLSSILLYRGGTLHTTLASDVNPATHRNFAWTIPFSLPDASNYMIRVELNSNGSTLIADSGIFAIFSKLPHVIAQSAPAVPESIGQVSSLWLTFNVPMNPASFDAGTDIVSFINPEGTDILGTITGTSWSAGDTVLTIAFTPPVLQGSYQLVIGPEIEDTAGNKMDQDGDGTTGESADCYSAIFNVNPPLIRNDKMDTDPGWTFSANNPATNGWAWGQPRNEFRYNASYGIPNPTSGYNGSNTVSYNLKGDYERGITEIRWAITPVMDCSNYQNVRLRFQRWLGVYYGSTVYGGTTGDNAYIEVSNDGTTWVSVWHNTNAKLSTAAWAEVEYDISAVADGQPTVYIRWGMGRTNSSVNDDSCGWNIDDVIVYGDYVDNTDSTPPFPNPMTFGTAPRSLGASVITMTAITALDANGVEYYFAETSGNLGGSDSFWQDSPTYTDTGLQVNTEYTYTVKARDKSPAQNETSAAAPASVSTDAAAILTLVLADASIGESDGPGATTATVTRNTDTSSSLSVNLSSSDTTEANVPASVTIAAGQSTSPVFNVNAWEDAIVDGTQTVTITATAPGHMAGSAPLDVADDVPITLTVLIGTNGAASTGGGQYDPDASPFAISATPATGYSFGQWIVVAGDASFGNSNSASTTVETTSDATVQANFVVGSYSVTYLGNGSNVGSVPVDVSGPYDYNASVTVLGNTGSLIRIGHTFDGWNTASDGSGTRYAGGDTFSIAGDTTLFAQWIPDTYTITYHANGATSGTAPDPQIKIYNVPLALASNSGGLVKSESFFVGWNTAANGMGTTFAEGATYSTNAPITLYAKWAIENALTWDANGTAAGQANGGGVWLGDNLWWNGVANQNWLPGVIAIFGGSVTAGGTVTISSPTSVDSLRFDAFTGTYTLGTAGTAITLIDGIIKNTGSGAVTFVSPITLGADQSWANHSDGLLRTGNGGNLIQNNGYQLTLDGTGPITFGEMNTTVTIAGSGPLVKNGPGVLEVGGVNTNFSGNVTINGGALRMVNNAGGLGSGNITLNGGILDAYWALSISRTLGANAGEIQLPGGVSGFGMNGNGQTFTITFNGSSTYEVVWGSPYFNPAVLAFQASTAQGTAHVTIPNKIDLNGTNRTIHVDGGTTGAARATLSGQIRNSIGVAGLSKTGEGMLTLSSSSSAWNGPTDIQGGLLDFTIINLANIGGGSGRNITLAAGAGVRFNALSNAILHRFFETTDEIGVMTATTGNNLDFSGSAGANLPNAFLGNFASSGVKAELSGTITPASDCYRLGAKGSSGLLGIVGDNKLTGARGLIVGGTGGSGIRVMLSGANDFTGDTVINAGAKLTLGNNLAMQNSALDVGATGGSLALNSAGTITGAVPADSPTFGGLKGSRNLLSVFTNAGGNDEFNLAATSVTGFTLNPGTGKSQTYSGAIADFAAGTTMTKTGLGTQILAGTNSYSGATTVDAGKLVIDGSLSNVDAALTVASGATLGGKGTIGRNVTIADGGKLEFDISTVAASHDGLEILTGRSFAFAGASELTISMTDGAAIGTYTLVTGGNNISGVAPAILNLPVGSVATVSISGNSLLLHVTAIGEVTYSVSYNGNGNTGGTAPVDANNYTNGATVTVLGNTGSLVKTGYAFSSWNTEINGSGTSYAPATNFTINTNTTLFAQWTPMPVSVITDKDTVHVPEDGTETFQVKLSDQPSGDTTVTVSRTAGDPDITVQSGGTMTFTTANWDTWQTVTLAAAIDGDTENSTATITCEASDPAYTAKNVTAIKAYTVSYNANNADSGTIPDAQAKTHGFDLTLAVNSGSLAKGGYRFDGWNTFAAGTGTDYAEGATYADDANLALYAKWTPTVPDTPTDLVATASVDRVELSWSVSINTASSVVKRSTSTGGPYTHMGSTTGSTFEDTTVANGGHYFYVVAAGNAVGMSADSSEVDVQIPVSIPFADNFETLTLGELNGQNNWQANGASVQTNVVSEGSQAVQIASDEGYVRQEFVGTRTNVWIDFHIQPARVKAIPNNLDADSTAVLYFNTNGHPVVYDGTTPVVVETVTVATGEWVRVTMQMDYVAKTWNLYINTTQVATNLAFYDTTATAYTSFSVKGGGITGAALDDVLIDLLPPFDPLVYYTIIVNSAHGAPIPSGATQYAHGTEVSFSMPDATIMEGSTTQYVASGWVATGSPVSSATGTNGTFQIFEDSSITWQWSTNYWMELVIEEE